MSDPSELYKIGTVAKLTGIAVERLRAWERRYGLTPASREGKTRFFSGIQVERLQRIKRLIDQGHPVSTLINLDDAALNERLQVVAQQSTEQPESTPGYGSPNLSNLNVALIGTQLLMLEQTQTSPSQVNVVSRWVNQSVAAEAIDKDNAPDTLVVLLGSVTPASLDDIESLPAKTKPVVVYHYATEQGMQAAKDRAISLLRWPIAWTEIEQALVRQSQMSWGHGPLAARRFSDEQLLSIASSGPGLGCACPADLVHLISTLNAFSEHALACPGDEQDDRQDPRTQRAPPGRADRTAPRAPRHLQIAQRTSQARLELEQVLEDWVLAEEWLPTPN